jgi:hypothetical protein
VLKMRREIPVIIVVMMFMQCVIFSYLYVVEAEKYDHLDYASYPGNHCLSFDGEDDLVDISTDPAFELDNLTIEAWIRPRYIVCYGSNLDYKHQYGTIVSRRDNTYGGVWGYWIGFDYSVGQLCLIATFGGSSVNYLSYKTRWENTSWYHIAITYNRTLPSDNLNLYWNETRDFHIDETRAIAYYPGRLQIGVDAGGAGHHFGGLIDEVRVWNISKTLTELQKTMGRILDIPSELANPNLMGYWRFDEGSGSGSHDYSIYHHDASLGAGNAAPQWVEPGAPIVPEFPSLLAIVALATATPLMAVLWRRRFKKSGDQPA